LQQAHAFVAVCTVHDVVMLIAQVQANQIGDVLVILDHEDASG
jgi:hypothetical protein